MFGWFGELGGKRKNHTHRCATSFFVAHRWKVRKTSKNIFRHFNTCNLSPTLLFRPRNPKSIFLKIQKDAHRNLDRNPRRKKLIWSIMVPFGVKSDPNFWAQKKRIRVRVSSFRTAETVLTPVGRKTEKLKNCFFLLHMAIQAVLTWEDGAETYCGSK